MFGIPIPSLTAIKWGAIAFGALGLLAGGFYSGVRWEEGKYEKLVATNATALTKATAGAAAKQHKIDDANQGDAVAQAYLRGKLDATTVTLKQETPANVTILQDQQAAASVHAGCVTYGFARMLYAGAHGVTADSIPLPSGESVDACTGLDPSELAAQAAQDLAAGYGNGQQLDSLIAAVKRNDQILAGGK